MSKRNPISAILTAMFAAVYAVGVYLLTPISFLPFQVRVADALLPLAILFGWPAIIGLSIGAFVANFFGPLGVVDIVGGALANFIATFLAWRISRNKGRFWKLIGVAEEIADGYADCRNLSELRARTTFAASLDRGSIGKHHSHRRAGFNASVRALKRRRIELAQIARTNS